MSDATSPATRPADAARLIELEREKAALTERLQDAEASLERVRRAYTHALEQLQLLRRRLYVASAERAEVDATQLAFDAMFEQVQALSKTLDAAALADDGDECSHTRWLMAARAGGLMSITGVGDGARG